MTSELGLSRHSMNSTSPHSRGRETELTHESDGIQERKNLIGVDVSSIKSNERRRARPKHPFMHILTQWWLECSTCLLAVLVFMALIVTLYKQQRKTLQKYSLGITINSLASIYIVILKAACVFVVAEGIGQLKWLWFRKRRRLNDFAHFDRASRGPWGSLILIWTLKHRSIGGTFGALIILTTIALDPFAQQILSFYSCEIPAVSNNATIPRSNFYVAGDHTASRESAVPIHLQNAINSGLFGNSNDILTQPICPSGNCTFPPFSTIGYCSSCVDISDTITFTNLTYKELPPNFQELDAQSTATRRGISHDNGHANHARDSSSPGVSNDPDAVAYQSYQVPVNYSGGYISVIYDTYKHTGSGGPLSFMEVEGDGQNFTVLTGFLNNDGTGTNHMPCDGKNQNEWPCIGQGAATCTLKPCVRTMSTTMNGGKLTEDVHEIVYPDINGANYAASLPLALVNQTCVLNKNQSAGPQLSQGTPTGESGDWLVFANPIRGASGPSLSNNQLLPVNASSNPNAMSNFTVDPACSYSVHYGISEAMQGYLASFLKGYAPPGSTMDPWTPEFVNITTPTMAQFFQGGNITFDVVNSTFQSIAAGITREIRENGPGAQTPASPPALGVIWEAQTCIAVRWGWTVYPAIMVVFALAFTCIVIVETGWSDEDLGDWKNSALPVIFAEMGGTALDARGKVVNMEQMDELADKMHVRLEQTSNGWKLRDDTAEIGG